jgi:uncharacterized protein
MDLRLRPPTSREASGVTIAILGASTVITNVWLPAAAYVPWNLAIAGGSVALARASGCENGELGADPRRLRGSVRVGVMGAAAVASGYAVASITWVDAFRDERVTSLSTPTALWTVLVRIPAGTVLAEETLFRGVLPAVLTSSYRRPLLSGVVSSVLFGLWHVLPSLELPRANVAVHRLAGDAGPRRVAAAAFAATSAAGLVLHSLRRRTGHLAAPVLVHMAVNCFGFMASRYRGRS